MSEPSGKASLATSLLLKKCKSVEFAGFLDLPPSFFSEWGIRQRSLWHKKHKPIQTNLRGKRGGGGRVDGV